MKIYLILISLLLLVSCSKDKEITDIVPISTDYKLPQGKSSADDRIVALYNQYSSYFLYEFTERDFVWTLTSDGSTKEAYSYTEGDPQYVGDMLDLLDEIWFGFYSKEFHQRYMPYRVFLTSVLINNKDGKECYLRQISNQIAVGYCSKALLAMTGKMKLEYKNDLQISLWKDWVDRGVFDIPREFYTVSDYSKEADLYDPSSPDYARVRGFVANSDGGEWCGWVNWQTKVLEKTHDLRAFLTSMVSKSSEQWESDLQYPLVKKKYNILRDYFLKEYDFDIQKIGDAMYE